MARNPLIVKGLQVMSGLAMFLSFWMYHTSDLGWSGCLGFVPFSLESSHFYCQDFVMPGMRLSLPCFWDSEINTKEMWVGEPSLKPCHQPTVWPYICHFAPLGLGCLICKKEDKLSLVFSAPLPFKAQWVSERPCGAEARECSPPPQGLLLLWAVTYRCFFTFKHSASVVLLRCLLLNVRENWLGQREPCMRSLWTQKCWYSMKTSLEEGRWGEFFKIKSTSLPNKEQL